MATAPKRLCGVAGCGLLIDANKGSRCERHKRNKRYYDVLRSDHYRRLYNHQWRKARLIFLKENPLCVDCLLDNKVTAAGVVDQIIPHKEIQFCFGKKIIGTRYVSTTTIVGLYCLMVVLVDR